jgi:hypothetical protein
MFHVKKVKVNGFSFAVQFANTMNWDMAVEDFEKVKAVRGIFGERTEEVLHNLKVDLTWFGGYIYVDSSNGHLVVSARYLNSGDKVDIYLDVIYELCHVRQFMEGKELFDNHTAMLKGLRKSKLTVTRFKKQSELDLATRKSAST